jgi:hypothetical protein
VLKRDGTVQPFDKTKLASSIKSAGATEQQASLVSDRVISRLGNQQTVPSSVISGMVASSLFKVNPVASSQYASFRNQKPRSQLVPTAKSATIVATTTVPVKSATPTGEEGYSFEAVTGAFKFSDGKNGERPPSQGSGIDATYTRSSEARPR